MTVAKICRGGRNIPSRRHGSALSVEFSGLFFSLPNRQEHVKFLQPRLRRIPRLLNHRRDSYTSHGSYTDRSAQHRTQCRRAARPGSPTDREHSSSMTADYFAIRHAAARSAIFSPAGGSVRSPVGGLVCSPAVAHAASPGSLVYFRPTSTVGLRACASSALARPRPCTTDRNDLETIC